MCKAGLYTRVPSATGSLLSRIHVQSSIDQSRYHSIRYHPIIHPNSWVSNCSSRHLCLVFEASSLDVLVGDNGVEVDGTLLGGTDLGVGVGIKLVALVDVEVDGVGPGDDEESKGYDHGALGADGVRNIAEDDRNDGTTGDGGDEEGSTALGVATETTEGKSEDNREDTGLEEEHNHEESKTAPVGSGSATSVDTDGSSKEDHDESLVGKQDHAGLDTKVHESSSAEATDGEQRLSNGVVVGTLVVSIGGVKVGVSLGEVVDEEGGDTDLSTNIAELSGNTEEESVLLAERLVLVSSGGGHHLSLVGHI